MSRYSIALYSSQDLDRIAEYFLERNIDAGEKLFREFNQKCLNLVNFPSVVFLAIVSMPNWVKVEKVLLNCC